MLNEMGETIGLTACNRAVPAAVVNGTISVISPAIHYLHSIVIHFLAPRFLHTVFMGVDEVDSSAATTELSVGYAALTRLASVISAGNHG